MSGTFLTGILAFTQQNFSFSYCCECRLLQTNVVRYPFPPWYEKQAEIFVESSMWLWEIIWQWLQWNEHKNKSYMLIRFFQLIWGYLQCSGAQSGARFTKLIKDVLPIIASWLQMTERLSDSSSYFCPNLGVTLLKLSSKNLKDSHNNNASLFCQ